MMVYPVKELTEKARCDTELVRRRDYFSLEPFIRKPLEYKLLSKRKHFGSIKIVKECIYFFLKIRLRKICKCE
jgi:hypothetical protein